MNCIQLLGGGASGSLDASNMLSLHSRGDIRCIGATTPVSIENLLKQWRNRRRFKGYG